MRKIWSIVLTIGCVILCAVPLNVRAETDLNPCDEVYETLDGMLYDSELDVSAEELSEFSISAIFGYIKDRLAERLTAPARVLAVMLCVVVFTAFLDISGRSQSRTANSEIFGMVCVLTAVTVISPELFRVYGDAFSAVNRTGGFISVFVPIFSGLTAANGGLASAGVYNLVILTASEVAVSLTNAYFMPIVGAVSALAVSGSVFADSSLEKVVALLKKLITWGMTVTVTLFTGFVTMKCTIAGKADGAAAKTVKFALSGFVPIVGGAVSDAYSTVRGSFDIIRTSAGAVGTAAILLMILPPILEIALFRAVMWITSTAAELFSVEPIAKLMKALDGGLAVAQGVLVCYSAVFVVCTGIILNCT